ncbi:hypothetical protein ANCCAN_02121 [Ancylostoma caninum]|uniref:Uncharacterized protein n=1 Tax=Ancylostoma caninum TaxID=29170 RepID=A0A368H579_ANCCA|nr:hypothetical protein ANCCAN_02121 [Ancylostoma caninum]
MDLIEERIRQRSSLREASFGGQKQSWNYRSESNVVLSRKEEMEQREKIRRELKLIGADRKVVGVVDSH